MLMFKEDGGFHHFTDEEVAQARKTGWVDGEPVRQRIMVLKESAKPATIEAHEAPKPRGRPRKADVTSTEEV